MIKRLAIWYLLRRANRKYRYWDKCLASMNPERDSEWLARDVSILRANNLHAIRALESVRDMEGT